MPVRGRHFFMAARQDLAFALRGLRRSPGLAFIIVLSLSLGVGANVAVFTALDRVFLQAPPGIDEPQQLRRLYARIFYRRGPDYGTTGRVTPNLSTRDMEVLGAFSRGTATLAGATLEYAARLDGSGRVLSG